jgi:serine protease Do
MTRLFPRTALLAALALAACGASDPAEVLEIQPQKPAAQASAPQDPAASRHAALPDFSALVKKAGPAVVNVITRTKPGAQPPALGQVPEEFRDFFRRFMPEMPPPGARQGMGSGFIISAEGLVLTNAHVVANAERVTVRLADAKREFEAKVVGADPRTDVAVLKLEASGLPVLELGDSASVSPGDWVAAIGSPFGFANTITGGIVSAVGRSLPGEAYVPFIQTDVAVNPGNSGGPLLTLDGKVVGINSMIYSGTGGYMGVSFAIPIEIALDVAKELQASGKVTRGRIGVAAQPLTRELAQAFGLKEARGALVASVDEDGPAAKAGVQPGDVVTRYNGKPVEDMNDLPRLVAASKPGENATLTVWRDGREQQLKVTPGELPPERVAQAAPGGKGESTGRLGVAVSELPAAERKSLGVDYAVVVREVQKPGVPLRPGDVIVAVNRSRFGSLQEFRSLIDRQKGERVALLVRRGEGTIYVPVEVG